MTEATAETRDLSKRAHPLRRVSAKFVDLLIVMALAGIVWSPLGPLLGFIYSIVSDAIPLKGFEGQSLGKKIFKLHIVSTRGTKIGLRESVFRNAPVGVATFFALIPIWGWAILALIGFPLMVVEIYLIVRAPKGQRLGDVMGDTEVVEV